MMTPKQIERVKKKISDIKKTLASEKRKYGGYDDSRGLRYLPTKYFIELGDFSGGLTYTKWFDKNFPDDMGFPDFLFEWTIILFKKGKIREAEKKAFETFCRNTYFFDKYFGRPVIPIDKWEGSNLEVADFTKYLIYSSKQHELSDFTDWLNKYISTERFISLSAKYTDIHKHLKVEQDQKKRHELIQQATEIEQSA